MTAPQRWILYITVAGLTCFLTGCFFSYDAILTAENARARPLAKGLWDWCEISEGGVGSSCEPISITLMADREYRFAQAASDREDAEAPVVFRFRKISAGVWLGQGKELEGSDNANEDNPYFYYRLERVSRRDFRLFWMDCRLAPPRLVSRLLEESQIENAEPGRPLGLAGRAACLVPGGLADAGTGAGGHVLWCRRHSATARGR